MYAFPYIMFKNADSITTFTPICTIKLLNISLKINVLSFISLFGFLYKNIPYINPINPAVIVKPGKYAPNGKISAPIKSPNAATAKLYLGPKYTPHSIIGIKLKLITRNEVLIDKNLDRTSSILKNIAANISFFVFVIVNLLIKKAPF